MHPNTTATRRIQVTAEDMERLRELVRGTRQVAGRDRGHLAALDEELDGADVVDTEAVAADVVTMHSVVRVLDLDSGGRVTYTVVFPEHADIEQRRISVLAPIGTALIGYRTGDEIEWGTPGGTRRLRIEEVLYQPEAAAA